MGRLSRDRGSLTLISEPRHLDSPLLVFSAFFACALAIFLAGTQLSKYGDAIAEKTGMGRTWIGLVLLATVTSLPELITGTSSVVLHDLPDIAVGAILGSCMCNILIIALLDCMSGPKPVSHQVHEGHVLSAGFGQLMLGLACLDIVAEERLPTIGWIEPLSPLFILLYILAMKLIYQHEKKRVNEFMETIEVQYRDVSLKKAVTMFTLNSLVVVAAGVFLPDIGDRISTITGLGDTFVGSVLIAISTSLPEIVVCISAAKIGAFDMAVGNLLGSNLFNLAILSLDDALYLKGPLLEVISPTHLVGALCGLIMTSIAIIGLSYRAEKKATFIAWDALGIAFIYVVGTMILYMMISK
ncbi:MAG: sodium:calcium antiporter [Candidatus Obscuribacterales bacterium]|nr:sodium:calcium antiporter [Cyanobacteria bacterium HKST-UBA01]MCB9468314.1 sodium:calcium antiporter [Candidatus Obscuribacterales bacterium]